MIVVTDARRSKPVMMGVGRRVRVADVSQDAPSDATMSERTLETELEKMREVAAARATPERAALQAEALAEIDRLVSGRALATGAKAPDFSLRAAADGRDVSLSGLLARGPVVLSFYRGHWCPYCNVELRAVERRYADIKALGAEVLFIGPETREHALAMAEKAESRVPILCDIDGHVMDAYGLTFEVPASLRPMYERFGFPNLNPKTGWKLPVPATYVIRPDGVIAASFANADYRYRMDPEDILAALRRIVTPGS